MTEATFQIIQKIYELTLIFIQLGIIVSLFFIFVPNEGITIRKRNLFIATISVERLVISFVTAETKGVFLVISAVTVLLFFYKRDREMLPLLVYLYFLWNSIFSICFIFTGFLSDSISDFLLERIDYASGNAMESMYNQLTIWIVIMAFIYVVCVTFELVIVKRIVRKKYLMSFKQACLLSVYSVVALLMMYMLSEISIIPLEKEVFIFSEQDISIRIKLPVMAVLLFLGQLSGVVLWQEFQKLKEQELENQKIIASTNYAKKYIEDLDSYHTKIRILRHDMAGKLTTLRGLIESHSNEEVIEYLSQMGIELNSTMHKFNTGNALIDVIVNEKSALAEEKGILFESDFLWSNVISIPPYDIGVIMTNLLDNAITECMEYNHERRIILRGIKKDSFFIVEVKNTFTGTITKFDDGLPVTTKSGEHGLGLKSVKQIAEKYLGGITIENKDGWYSAMVMLQNLDQL